MASYLHVFNTQKEMIEIRDFHYKRLKDQDVSKSANVVRTSFVVHRYVLAYNLDRMLRGLSLDNIFFYNVSDKYVTPIVQTYLLQHNLEIINKSIVHLFKTKNDLLKANIINNVSTKSFVYNDPNQLRGYAIDVLYNHGVELDDNVIIPNMARHEFTYIDKTVYTNKIICRMIDYLSELKK